MIADYLEVLAATNVTGYPYVKGTSTKGSILTAS
jgi:hypothetical protein